MPPLNADERTTLESWLDFHRTTLAVKCEELDDKQRCHTRPRRTQRRRVPAAAGLGADQALRVWLLIHEQPDGAWGAGGKIMRYTEVAGLAMD